MSEQSTTPDAISVPGDHPDAIPVIDFSGAQDSATRPAVVAAVTEALAGVGAFHATGTLVAPEVVSRVADAFRPFFEDWSEEARAVHTARESDAGARGYVPRFSAAEDPTGAAADQLRSFIFHPAYDPRFGVAPLLELEPAELWAYTNLVPAGLPGALNALRIAAALFAAVRGEVLSLLEEGLGRPAGTFAGWFGHGDASTVVVNHYRRVPGHTAGGVCLVPHTDLGALTINALDGRAGIKGLYYQARDGRWIVAAEPPAGALPVFAGRLLELTGAARALPHYVRCSEDPDAANRMSVVGFGQPAVNKPVTTAPGVTEPFGDYYAREIGRGRLLTADRSGA